MSKSKAKGTAWETAIVGALRTRGFVCRRKVLAGKEDTGDIEIDGIPVIIEAKNCNAMSLAGWVHEANEEAKHAKVNWGVVWHHRKGRAFPEDAYVTVDGRTFMEMLPYLQAASQPEYPRRDE